MTQPARAGLCRPSLGTLLLLLLMGANCTFAAEAAPAPGPARTPYPLQICIVSGEHLEAGQIVEYTHKEAGKPDRELRLCCRKCLARFKADPAKYLKKLDAATPPGRKN